MMKTIALVTTLAGLPALPNHAAIEALTGSAPPVPSAIADLPSPDPDALLKHFLCWELSRAEVLGPGIARTCSQAFLAIKLGFVPDMTPARYLALPAKEKARVNRAGYAAWRQWVDANGARVAEYRRVARNLIHGAGS